MQRAARTRLSGVFCLVVAVATFPLSGCTLVGAGIGAAIDQVVPGPYEARDPVTPIRVEKGEQVDVGLRNGRYLKGRYLGARGPTARDPETYLEIEANGVVSEVPVSELGGIGVEVSGKGWLYGGIVGLVVDVVVVAAVSVEGLHFSPLGNSPLGNRPVE